MDLPQVDPRSSPGRPQSDPKSTRVMGCGVAPRAPAIPRVAAIPCVAAITWVVATPLASRSHPLRRVGFLGRIPELVNIRALNGRYIERCPLWTFWPVRPQFDQGPDTQGLAQSQETCWVFAIIWFCWSCVFASTVRRQGNSEQQQLVQHDFSDHPRNHTTLECAKAVGAFVRKFFVKHRSRSQGACTPQRRMA